MMAASAVGYSSVNQCENNRSIMWRQLNSCSACDRARTNSSFRRQNSIRSCRHHQHFRHTRRPAIRQNKRCTFSPTTTILSSTTSPLAQTGTVVSVNSALKNGASTSRYNSTTVTTIPSSQTITTIVQVRQPMELHQEYDTNTHQLCQSQSSNSSNTSSVRMD